MVYLFRIACQISIARYVQCCRKGIPHGATGGQLWDNFEATISGCFWDNGWVTILWDNFGGNSPMTHRQGKGGQPAKSSKSTRILTPTPAKNSKRWNPKINFPGMPLTAHCTEPFIITPLLPPKVKTLG